MPSVGIVGAALISPMLRTMHNDATVAIAVLAIFFFWISWVWLSKWFSNEFDFIWARSSLFICSITHKKLVASVAIFMFFELSIDKNDQSDSGDDSEFKMHYSFHNSSMSFRLKRIILRVLIMFFHLYFSIFVMFNFNFYRGDRLTSIMLNRWSISQRLLSILKKAGESLFFLADHIFVQCNWKYNWILRKRRRKTATNCI